MRNALLLAFALVAFGFAPAPFPKAERKDDDPNVTDLARLQGTWEETAYIVGPQRTKGDGTRAVVAGSRMTFHSRNGNINSDWMITLDARARPKGMSCSPRKGTAGAAHESVYSLEGDTLTLCYPLGRDYNKRPAALTPGPDRAVMILVRVGK
jgi:uncharacterized protein (TIGR03067 family)